MPRSSLSFTSYLLIFIKVFVISVRDAEVQETVQHRKHLAVRSTDPSELLAEQLLTDGVPWNSVDK